MRLIYLTDTHIQGGRPENRRDDFLEALFGKFTEIIGLCRRLKVDFVIHGGDLFDRPQPDQKSLDLFRWLLKELDLPVYCIAGNHDLIDQRLDSLEQTALGYLARNRWVRLLQPGEKTYLANNSCVVQLSGQHFYGGIDRKKNSRDYMVKKRRCDLAVHVVHGMLLPRPFSDKVPCTLISEVAGTEADFTLGAHAHLGYHETAGGKFFLNPGALARLTGLEKELVRIPQVLYLDFTSTASYSFIPLRTVRPGREVMDINPPGKK
ncbi:MAG: metallophosphoesterase [Peptococcaceae bacterium]|nr:metallophosphoesterase [Peptococcaceae bacterium]